MNKTLVLTENFPPVEGGSGRWFWELYSRLPGEQVVVATNNTTEQIEPPANGMVIERLPLQSAEWGIKSVTGLMFYVKSVVRIIKLIKKHNIKEIHCGRVIHEGVIAWLASKVTGVTVVCYVHGEDVEVAAVSREHSLLVKQVCKCSHTLICNSENSKALVQKLNFAEPDKCVVLHPGFDAEHFQPVLRDEQTRKAFGWDGKFSVITVGRLQRRKGQDYFIQAMPELLKRFPTLHYTVIGRGELEQELREKISALGLSDNVQVVTDADDDKMAAMYQQCDLFILPNRTIGGDIEGFGMVLLEAQACGKYVVAGNSGGTKETMRVGETGFVIDCNSPSDIVEGFSMVMQKLPSLNVPPSEYVRNTFSWDVHVEKARALFDRFAN
jgi:phosphatidylinositol alpha-1,6-mannosyltransferase